MELLVREQLNSLLDVGFASKDETSAFKEVLHDDYVEALQRWLQSFSPTWVAQPDIVITHGLSDRGVDLTANFSLAGFKVGFQIWSYNDIARKDLHQDVWRQIGESGSHNIDLLYVILCGDMSDRSQFQKVRLFTNQVEQGKYPTIELIPPEKAWKLYEAFSKPINIEEVQQRVSSFKRFMTMIGRGRELHIPDSVYANLEALFVQPSQYPAIREKINSHDIVIIMGPPHVGKTFTAIKLLYDYLIEGYQPFWVFNRIGDAEEELQSLQEAYSRNKIHDVFSLETMIRPGCIVYLEDPYGSTSQEELNFVNSQQRFRIDHLLQLIRSRSLPNQKHPKVVITSREGIFLRALQQQPELSEYSIALKLGADNTEELDVSYDFGARVRLTEKYAALYKPKWMDFSQEEEKKTLEDIGSLAVSYLWTPHSLQRFLFTSRDTSIDDPDELRRLIVKAADISESFAAEINLLDELHQVVFISIYLENHYRNRLRHRIKSGLQKKYEMAAMALGYSEQEAIAAWNNVTSRFASILEHLEISVYSKEPLETLRFLHPAYLESVAVYLSKNPQALDNLYARVRHLFHTEAGLSFAQDLINLLRFWNHRNPRREAQILADYHRSNNREILIELAEEYAVTYALTEDETLKSTILSLIQHPKLEEHQAGRNILIHVAHTARHLSIAQRCDILLAALDVNPRQLVQRARPRPYDLVCQYYDEVTPEVRNHLEQFVETDHYPWGVVGRSLGQYYDTLPGHLRTKVDQAVNSHTFFPKREIIAGLILGYGKSNKEALPLLKSLMTSAHRTTRAYVARSLVLIYDDLDDTLQKDWHQLVSDDPDECATAAANHIFSLCSHETLLSQFVGNGLVDFVLELATSSSAVARAEVLRTLLSAPDMLKENAMKAAVELLFDDEPIVRAASLFVMLSNSELQEAFPERYQELLAEDSDYAEISKLLHFFSLKESEVSPDLQAEIEALQATESLSVRNALVFHAKTQLPFLLETWREWVEDEAERRDINDILRAAQQNASEDHVRRIYKPHWFIDYKDIQQLFYYEPELGIVESTSLPGVTFTIKIMDELELMALSEQIHNKLTSALESTNT